MTETQIILILVALAVIGFIFLRSRREENSVKRRSRNNVFEEQRPDVLMDNNHQTASIAASPAEATKEELDKVAVEPAKDVPQEEPPIYEDLEKERQENVDVTKDDPETPGFVGIAEPHFDYGVQWVLDMSSIGTKGFSYGAVDALHRDVMSISSALPVELWARSVKDGLYYPFKYCPNESNHIMVAVTMANRTATLDELTASRYMQAMEQVATYSGTDVRSVVDFKTMLNLADRIGRFVKHFDSQFEILLVPRAEGGMTPELLERVVCESGFVKKADHSGWEFRFDPEEREPVLSLASRGEADGTLHLSFDIPVASLVRGDLKQFFQLANHLANHLNAVWVDCERQPIHAGGALILQEEVSAKLEKMAAAGVKGGSARAKLIFSRQA